MRNYIFLVFLLILFEFKFKSDKAEGDTSITVDKSEFKRGKDLNPKDWNCIKIENDDLCCPSNWKPIKQDKYYYFSNLENSEDYTSFVILRYPVSSTGITPELYLKETYSQGIKDTVDKFTGYTVKKLVFQDMETYYSEFFSERSNKKYLTYSMIFEKNNYLYDFCLKVEKEESVAFMETFKNILFNFKVRGENVWDEDDEIEKIEIIDLSKL